MNMTDDEFDAFRRKVEHDTEQTRYWMLMLTAFVGAFVLIGLVLNGVIG